MRRRSFYFLCLKGLAAMAGVAFAPRVASGSSFDNGGPGGYLRQPPPVNWTLRQGHALQQGNYGYHSAICTVGQPSDWIVDDQFYNLCRTNLAPGGNERYDSLIIHMSQCNTGGMIDEFELGDLDNFSFNTAARWFRPSQGQEFFRPPQVPPNNPQIPRDFYGYAWNERVFLNPNINMLQAYQQALTSPSYPQVVRNREGPQYFSRGNGDAQTLGGGADKNLAVLFVGSDIDPGTGRGYRHYYDAQRMYHTLRQVYGYNAADIKVYYHDGTPPPNAPALPGFIPLPIDGAATKANLSAALQNIGGQLAGNDDQVFLWTSDHGTVAPLWRNGRVQPRRPGRGGVASAEFEVDLSTYLTDLYADGDLFIADPMFSIDEVVIPDGAGPLSIYVNGVLVADNVTGAGTFHFSPEALVEGTNLVRFDAFGPNAEQIEIADFGINVQLYTAPEPASILLILAGTVAILRRRDG